MDTAMEILCNSPLTSEQLAVFNDRPVGFDAALGLRYLEVSPEKVVAEATVTDGLRQVSGIVHGGVYAAIAESVGSVASIAAAKALAVGVNNSTDFISSTSEGTIRAVGTPVQLGRRTHLWRIEMSNNERLVAVCTLRTMVLEQR